MSDFPRPSYSIEAEDLLIHRMFEAVVPLKQPRSGRFLDLGAHHPVNGSNTYLFYKQGWRGINVEPNPAFIEDFARERPEDITLNIGLSDRSETLTYHRFNDSLVNGFLHAEDLAATIRNGYTHLGSQQIACLGIRDFLARHVRFEVDLLNIDIEQSDYKVLRAWDWGVCRPKVICAEIHADTVDDVRGSLIAGVLSDAGYQLMSRGWQSAVFVDARRPR